MKKLMILLFLSSLFMIPTNGFSIDNSTQLPWIKRISDYQIFVKTLEGKIIPIQVNSASTVQYVKNTLQAKEGYSSTDIMRLIYAGRVLEDGRTMADYNILRDTTIFLIIIF